MERGSFKIKECQKIMNTLQRSYYMRRKYMYMSTVTDKNGL